MRQYLFAAAAACAALLSHSPIGAEQHPLSHSQEQAPNANPNPSALVDAAIADTADEDKKTKRLDSASPVWEGEIPKAIPLPRGEDLAETSDFPELEVPPPGTEGALFSRKPLPAYVNPKNGHLVIEYTLTKLSRDGVNTLMIESCSLSPDGTELTIHRQRLYAPAAEKAQTHFVYKLKTSIPYRFIRDRHLYVFNVENAVIVSCNVFCIKKDRAKPTWKRCIYPAQKWAYGIMSPM